MKYDFRVKQSDEIRRLLRQDIDGPRYFFSRRNHGGYDGSHRTDPTQISEIDTQKSWQEFLMYYKPDM